MDQSRIEDFIANAALLAGHLTQQCEKVVAIQQAATGELAGTAEAVRQSVAAGKGELAQHARSALREALAHEIPAATQALTETGDRFRQMADRLQQEQASLALRTRILGWNAIALLGLVVAMVLGGTGYAARQNLARADQARVRAEVMEALQQVAITSCDGRPCLKLEDGLQRWKKNQDYVLVDTGTTRAPSEK